MDDNPFKKIKAQWLNKLRRAKEAKKEFDDDAQECMSFYSKDYSFLYGLKAGAPGSGSFIFTTEGEGQPRPSVAMTVNKVAELVQIFGPVLYHRNPVRKVNPRELPLIPIETVGDPQDPNVQAQYMMMVQQVQQSKAKDATRAALLEWYLNYTPNALDLKSEARQAIDEALIKGMGCLWTTIYTPPGSKIKMSGSFYDSVDNVLFDPDMENRRDAKFMSQRCCKPVWEFCAEYGLNPDDVHGNYESHTQQESVTQEGGEGELHRRKGETNNLIVYHKIWSKMGLGPMMSGLDWDSDSKAMDRFGQYVYLVFADTLDYFANVPPEIWGDDQQMSQALQWETPFWADDSWPMTSLVFHEVPRQVWPMSHIKPAMGELKFLNWAYSFLASKIKKISRDIIIMAKGADEEMKRVILSGSDMEVAYLAKTSGTIKEVVDFLQHPDIHGDMFKVLQLIETNFEKRTGLSEIMYGETAHAYRSAEEANVKSSQMHIRPDDMVNKTEDTLTDAARKEALAARWHLEGQDLELLMGPIGAQWWQQYVTPTDPAEMLHQLEYRTEANSARKPNKDKQASDADEAMKQLFTPLYQISQGSTGNVGPVNALLAAWAKAHDWDVEKFLIPPPPPPPPPKPDLPKIGVTIDFLTLNPFIQQKLLELGGIIPPGMPMQGPIALPPPPPGGQRPQPGPPLPQGPPPNGQAMPQTQGAA